MEVSKNFDCHINDEELKKIGNYRSNINEYENVNDEFQNEKTIASNENANQNNSIELSSINPVKFEGN